MKIPLHLGGEGNHSSKDAQNRVLERDLAAFRKGDPAAKANLLRSFLPLINSMAQKKTTDIEKIPEYVEAGKNGLLTAAKKFRQPHADKFQIFALDYIEREMDRITKGSGFLARLFGFGRK